MQIKKANSPDEYPYASSDQGGLHSTKGTVQLRCVPTDEQKGQGGKLKGIGTSSKDEEWETKWENIGSRPQDWCGANPTCKNDGHQFTSGGNNGPFTKVPDPKVTRDIGTYSEDGSTAWVKMRGDEPAEFSERDEIESRGVNSELEVRKTTSKVVGIPFES
ncbi:hypothetical protein F5B20DRAFT_578006 [Whalleya microplaca]|nr:hypothetical protein F5B20DRAFT_578006 [Whalleya microplaca]